MMVITATVSNAAAKNTGDNVTAQEKVIKDFNAEFSLTPKVSITRNGFMANSVVDGHQISSAYTKKGNRVYSIVRYTADNLDKNVVSIIKDSYDKYFITSMEKIEEPGVDAVYIVHLNNATSIKTVRVTANGSELLQNFKKI